MTVRVNKTGKSVDRILMFLNPNRIPRPQLIQMSHKSGAIGELGYLAKNGKM
jgi:hypothetical protein